VGGPEPAEAMLWESLVREEYFRQGKQRGLVRAYLSKSRRGEAATDEAIDSAARDGATPGAFHRNDTGRSAVVLRVGLPGHTGARSLTASRFSNKIMPIKNVWLRTQGMARQARRIAI
jgi:hypothetical protein